MTERSHPARVFELTFDDGPHAAVLGAGGNLTEMVLDALLRADVKAGFFIQTGVSYRGASPVGQELVRRMGREGHTVGIHTGGERDHEPHPEALKAGRLEGELRAAVEYVREVAGTEPTLVRPPGGVADAAVLAVYERVGLTSLSWDVDGDGGGSRPLPELCARLTDGIGAIAGRGWEGTARPGAVNVLLHDIQRGTAEHAGALIDHVRATTRVLTGGDAASFRAP
jgi:peptidoglycan/xylan/chitin deacetylase (PgdA/CDA1 family)